MVTFPTSPLPLGNETHNWYKMARKSKQMPLPAFFIISGSHMDILLMIKMKVLNII